MIFAALVAAVSVQTISSSMEYDGVTRTYTLVVPSDARENARGAPLVVVLHGYGGTGSGSIDRYGFVAAAERIGAIVVAPNGVRRAWNDGRQQDVANVDDVGFVTALVGMLRARYHIDASRIGAAGMSNGAIFAQRLACERSDLFTAVVSVAGSMPAQLACAPSRAVSVMLVAGTRDPLVPYDGGGVGYLHGRGEVIGAPETFARWRAIDRCGGVAPTVALPATVDDGTTVSLQSATGCNEGSGVALYTVTGGGHAWPEELRPLPALLVGIASANLDATNAACAFIVGHPR